MEKDYLNDFEKDKPKRWMMWAPKVFLFGFNLMLLGIALGYSLNNNKIVGNYFTMAAALLSIVQLLIPNKNNDK